MVPVLSKKNKSFAYQSNDVLHNPKSPEYRDLAVRYLPIVKHELMRVKMRIPNYIDMDDLHGVAIIGLMHALEKFSTSEEVTFGAYVRQRVRGAILDELRRMDLFTRERRKKARHYDQTVIQLEQKTQRAATEDEIREALKLNKTEFADLLEDLRPISFLSLDAPLSDDQASGVLADVVDDPVQDTARDTVEFKDIAQLLHERLECLPKKQQQILYLYYFKGLRLAEIAKVFSITESRVSQLHTQAIRKLQQTLEGDLIE
jgi:RNA polymerase sigma factor for flagellar operon FliA